jgi:hypothetical protein
MNMRMLTAATLVVCATGPALAHHSFAMFDRDKSVTMSGTVTEFEWTNPHVWIHMSVPASDGKPVVWSFEMQAIQADMAGGWRSDSVKPGDKVSIEFHPLKDGSRGGQLVSAVLANGNKLGGPVRRPGAQD